MVVIGLMSPSGVAAQGFAPGTGRKLTHINIIGNYLVDNNETENEGALEREFSRCMKRPR
jgi:hypothetical protein